MSNAYQDQPGRSSRDWPEMTLADGVSPLNRAYHDLVILPSDRVSRFPKLETVTNAHTLVCEAVEETVGTLTLTDGRLIKLDGTGDYVAASSLETVVRVDPEDSAAEVAAAIKSAVIEHAPDLAVQTYGAMIGIYGHDRRTAVAANNLSWSASTATLDFLRPNWPVECIPGTYHPQCHYLRLVSCHLTSATDTHATFSRRWQVDMERLGEVMPGLDIDALLKTGALTTRSLDQDAAPPREFVTWLESSTTTSAARVDEAADTDVDVAQSTVTPQNIAAGQKQTTRVRWGDRYLKTDERFDPDCGKVRTTTRQVVPAGTHGAPINDQGEIVTISQIDHLWSVQTTEQAMGLAGDAVNGVATRTRRYRDNWSWPRVLDHIRVWSVHSDSSNIYSPIESYGWRPVWLANAYNGMCDISMVERWTKKIPVANGDADWHIGPAWAPHTHYTVETVTGDEVIPASFVTVNGETYKCISSHESGDSFSEAYAEDLPDAERRWKVSSPDMPAQTPVMPQEIEFYGQELANVQISECLHSGVWLRDSSAYGEFPATTPPRWPPTILGRVLVEPDNGGWLTRMLYVDAPDTPGRSTGVELLQVDAGATSFTLEWEAGGGATKLDVSTDPSFLGGWLPYFHDLTVASTPPYLHTVTGAQRGRTYYARIRRTGDGLTSNTCICHTRPTSELAVFESGNRKDSGRDLTLGDAEVGKFSETTLTLTNIGLEPVRDLRAYLTPENDSMFELGALDTEISPGRSVNLTVRFRPLSHGDKTALLTLESNAAAGDYTLNLAATGTAPEITVELVNAEPPDTDLTKGETLPFGAVTSAEVVKTVRIRNDGNARLMNLEVKLQDGNAADWGGSTLPAPADKSIPAGGSVTCTLVFNPADDDQAYGARSTKLRITSSDANENPFILNLTGTSQKPDAAGAVDPQWDALLTGVVHAIAVQPDGKVLLGGAITAISGITRHNLVRVQGATGVRDTSFSPEITGTVRCIAVQPDGKILIGGSISSVGGTARSLLARINANGTLDTSFSLPVTGTEVRTILIMPDPLSPNWKVYIGGVFTAVGGAARVNLARIWTNGTLDAGWSLDCDGEVNGLTLLRDGSVMVCGLADGIPEPSPPPEPTIPPEPSEDDDDDDGASDEDNDQESDDGGGDEDDDDEDDDDGDQETDDVDSPTGPSYIPTSPPSTYTVPPSPTPTTTPTPSPTASLTPTATYYSPPEDTPEDPPEPTP